MPRNPWFHLVSAVLSSACSAGGHSDPLVVGNDGKGGSSSGPGGSGGALIVVGDGSAPTALSAHLESPPGVTVSFVTISCAAQCADVVAVASGGFEPYSFTWEDGSKDPRRRVCPTATTDYQVSVTDSGAVTPEFTRNPETVTVPLTANVIACPTDAGGIPPDTDSGAPVKCAPHRAFAALPNAFSPAGPVYAGYATGIGAPLVVIRQTTLATHSLDPECPHLFLSGDAAGTLPVGFDNGLLVEVHAAGGSPIVGRGYYGTDTLSSGGQPVPLTLAPTVPGLSLGIPGPGNFGYAPLAVDLAPLVSSVPAFDLVLTVVDSGGFASTTDVWIVMR